MHSFKWMLLFILERYSVCVVGQWSSYHLKQLDKEGKEIHRNSPADDHVQGATVALSPHVFFITSSFVLFSFSLPSKLPCGACWHGVSHPWTQSPSGPRCTRVGACLCASVSLFASCAHVSIHVIIEDAVLTHSAPSSPFSHICISMNAISQSHRQTRERVFLQKVYLVCWQPPNCKIVESQCTERIILNYSELKFKFHFVLALSNGWKCLSEISKGQGELKCLLLGLSEKRMWAKKR